MTLSPIHEHHEDVYSNKIGSSENTITIVEQDEEFDELVTKHSEQAAIKFARCSKDKETTNIEQNEESINIDQDKQRLNNP